MAEYDTIPKQLMHLYPQDLIRLALGREEVEIEVEEVLNTELPKVETRLVDSLIRVRIDGEEALIHHRISNRRQRGYSSSHGFLYHPPHRAV